MLFVACILIPLAKCPGVRPIDIGDMPIRIVTKVILFVIGEDIVSAAGPLQTCMLLALRLLFGKFLGIYSECEAALYVDVSNVLNYVNHQEAELHNISVRCPSFSTILNNTLVHLFFFLLLVKGKCHLPRETSRVTPCNGNL